MDQIKIEESVEYETEISVLESTFNELNYIMVLPQEQTIICEENTSKIEELIQNFDIKISKESINFLKLFESSTCLLNFIINFQETVYNLRNNSLKKIVQDVEVKIQNFENKFSVNYNILSEKYKLILEETNKFIIELNTTDTINHIDDIENKTEMVNDTILSEIEEELLNIESSLNDINNMHKSLNDLNNEIYNINNEIDSKESIRKTLELEQFTIKKLSTHIQNLSVQLSENMSEKDEALEEFTACIQQTNNKKNINNNSSVQDIKVIKNKTYNLVCEIRRINGEINTIYKQMNHIIEIKLDLEKNYKKKSLELLKSINNLTLEREKLDIQLKSLKTEMFALYDTFTKSFEIILKLQDSIKNLLSKNSQMMRLYWKNIQELQIKWNNLNDQLKTVQFTENKLITSLTHLQNILKVNVTTYYNERKTRNTAKLEFILLKINKSFQQYQNTEEQILTHLEFITDQINFLNSSTEEIKSIIPNNSFTFDTIVDNLIEKYNFLKTEADLFQNNFFKAKNLENFEAKETELEKLCENIENLDTNTNQLNTKYISYVTYNNNKVLELQSYYKKILNNCQTSVNTLSTSIKSSEHKLNILKDIKNELSKEIDTLITEKEDYVEKLQKKHDNIEKNIKIIVEDKLLLNSNLELITKDFIKLKAVQSCRNLTEKLNEIEETRNNIKYVIKLLENLAENMTIEWNVSHEKLANAEKSLHKSKHKLVEEIKIKHQNYLNLQNEVLVLKEKLKDLIQFENNIENTSQLLDGEITQLNNKHELYINKIYTLNSVPKLITGLKLTNLEKDIEKYEESLQEKSKDIQNLNNKLIENMEQLKSLNKHTLISELYNVKMQYRALQQTYKHIIQFEINFCEKIEQYIFKSHNFNFKKYFQDRTSIDNNSTEFQYQITLFILSKKQLCDILNNRLLDFHLVKENLCELCLEFSIQISFSPHQSIEQNITETINKLKVHEGNLEESLQKLYIKKLNLDKQYLYAVTEQEILTKIMNKNGNFSEINYQNLQLDCINCHNKILKNEFIKKFFTKISFQDIFQFWEKAINFEKSENDFNILELNEANIIELIKKIKHLKSEIENKDTIIIERENCMKQLKSQYKDELKEIYYLEKQIKSCDDNETDQNINHEEIISVLNKQLWTTVNKYVNLENENRKLNGDLNYYQNLASQNYIYSLYSWMIGNKYKEMKASNEELWHIFNKLRISESIQTKKSYFRRYFLLTLFGCIIFSYIFYFYSKILHKYN